uniref:Aldehyde:ferredoxin oxidoreductase n=2 Tax=Thermoproteati TaxID=1783275 RepID=E6NAM2_CALS0|nr:aldehyde:ferredoxin oxidoreductase [Candidatus Caldarchaeum subterraneum]BAL57034.1 aldehyde:ferredoxin oxidoreductase [uncultured crenarchaeote]
MSSGGLIGFIDLTNGETRTEPVSPELRRMFLGGRGLNMYLLYRLLTPGIDPLSPENVLIVGAGLLTGAPCLGAARANVSAKSPLTGAVGDSNIGGHFAVPMRRSGFDCVVVRGASEKPVRVLLSEGRVEVKDADDVWGLDTLDAQEKIRQIEGQKAQSLVIGQAGENLVRYANVRNGRKASAGRTGMGAVMGSKKLKAITAFEDGRIEWHDPPQLYTLAKKMNDHVLGTKWGQALSKYGSMVIFNYTYHTGLVRVKNFETQYLDDVGTLEPENMEKYTQRMTGCSACAVKCRHYYELDDGPYPHTGEGPEYSQLGSFGTMLGINKMEAVMNAVYLCNKYGLDTVETGNVIAWLMELYEKKIVDEKLLGGVRPVWGDERTVYQLIEMIALRRGVGDVLAEGMVGASKVFGPRTLYYANQIKGMGTILSDDRAVPSFALGIATATRGSDHLRSRPALDLYGLPEDFLKNLYGGKVSSDYTSYEGKSRMVWWHELEYAVVDSLGLCKFQTIFCAVHAPSFREWASLIKHATGMELTVEELMEIGERICAVERLFNIREGFSRRDDTLPERYHEEPTSEGLPKVRGKTIDREMFEKMLDEYYQLHGWGLDGKPLPETLKRLGLAEMLEVEA